MHKNPMRQLAVLFVACVTALPSLADVLIFGGTRGVGLETARSFVASGETVTVMVRSTSDLTALNEIDGVSTVVGDAMNTDDIAAAFASGEFNAVVSTLSGNPLVGFAVDSTGNINAADGAKAAGVERFVLVSSIGAGDSAAALPPPVLKNLAEVLAGKARAEAHLIHSGLTYTIVRPGVLTDKPANGNGILTQDTSLAGIISRAEVARVVVDSIGDEATYGKIYSALEQR
jgi:uncharacterized protein YbjT (DUF2867 family)